ncbi:MAG TPA: c-type cytochrome [Burkholderiales bacterium]|jgi:cytochrome c|nr:c-type cytochrome [Burkholderiales bacterium]
MKSVVVLALGLAAGTLVSAADAQEDLAKKDNCFACHAVDKKVVGPAYKDVAAKYRNDPKAAEKLFEKVKKGGSGVWGPVPMPPNAAVPDADIHKLVSWILSLK